MYKIDINPVIDMVTSIVNTNVSVADFIRYKYVHRYLKMSRELPVNIDIDKKLSCLDAGCGNGDFFKYIQNIGYVPIGIDMNVSNPKMNIHKEDMCHTSFNNNTFDAIVSIDSLYVEPLDVFKEFYRILKTGGCVVIHAPLPSSVQKHVLDDELNQQNKSNENTGNVRKSTDYERIHRQWYDFGELISVAEDIGFNIVGEYSAWGLFETFAYDIERLYYSQNNLIRSIAILLTVIDDISPHKEYKRPIGCITVLRK